MGWVAGGVLRQQGCKEHLERPVYSESPERGDVFSSLWDTSGRRKQPVSVVTEYKESYSSIS